MEHLDFIFFFHQQNVLRQPIKLYDINEFSATKKENVSRQFYSLCGIPRINLLIYKVQKMGKTHIWFCLISVKMLLFLKHLTYIKILTSVRKYLSVKYVSYRKKSTDVRYKSMDWFLNETKFYLKAFSNRPNKIKKKYLGK